MTAIGRTDLIGPAYAHNPQRVAAQVEIEGAISSWTRTHTADEVVQVMDAAGVPVGRVQSIKEVVENEQNAKRGALVDVPVGDWTVKMQGTFPVLDGVDSQPAWAGPELGAYTEAVLKEDLGLSEAEIGTLRADGVIA